MLLWADTAWSREWDMALAFACSLLAGESVLSGTALTLEASPRASEDAIAWARLVSDESARCLDHVPRSLLDLLPLDSGLGESWLPWCSGTTADRLPPPHWQCGAQQGVLPLHAAYEQHHYSRPPKIDAYPTFSHGARPARRRILLGL